jgi:uncharacterized protein YkwD
MFALLALLLAAQGGLPSQAQLESALQEAVTAACPRARIQIDRDLTRACQTYVQAAAAGRAEVAGDAAYFYASLESYEPSPIAGVASVTPASGADRSVAQLFPNGCHFNRAGVAAAADPEGHAIVCTLVADHSTDLDPIPGRVRAGESVAVTGRLGIGLSKPRVFVTRPNGQVEEIPLHGERLSAIVPLKQRGEHSIEVLADSSIGPQVAALRRVFAGVAPPDRPPKAQPQGKGLAGVEAAIAQLRAAHGLPALQRDPALDEVAEGHCREMARLKTLGHVLPSDGSLEDRLAAKGWAYRGAGENIGFSTDAIRAHEGIASSPAHLSNLLNPRHRRLGLGAVKGATADGAEGVYLTEVLASPIVGSKDPVVAVADEILRRRARDGLADLARDKMLDWVASKEVRTAASHDDAKPPAGATSRALAEEPELESAVVESYVASQPEEIAASRNLAEPRWTRLGVGAIYASTKQFGPGRLWVVLIYAR